MGDSQDFTSSAAAGGADEVAILVANAQVTQPVILPPQQSSSTSKNYRFPPTKNGGDEDHDNEGDNDGNDFPSRHPSQWLDGEASENKRFSCKKFIFKRLPILKWLPKYKPVEDLVPDAISGVTVGLTAIPQSMAYANVAGLTPEFGLYSSFISCFVYLFLGSCRQMTIGPTALMELLVYETCGQDFSSCVVLVGFWVGIIQLIMGLLKLGAVVSLISDPVTIGFVGGASLTICSSQIRTFFGLAGPKGDGFLGYIKSAIENIRTAKLGDSMLGLGCVLILLLFKNLKEYVKPDLTKPSGRYLAKFVWFLSIGRNAMVVIFASILAASLTSPPFALTGEVKSGLPPISPPDFSLPDHFPPNNSTESNLNFWETWGELGTAPLMIALISILQNVAIAKAFGSGQSIDATQEMIALGISHICGSFFSALPTAGSFTRSAVNEASGVRSPIGGIFTGLLVIFALSFLTRWFAYIPKASLAAVILCAVLPMIEYENIWPMWKVSKLDVLTALVTFLASLLLGMEYGIIIGVGVSLAIYLFQPIRPKVQWRIISVTRKDTNDLEENGDGRTSGVIISNSTDKLNDDDGDNEKRPLMQYHFIRPEQGFLFPSVDSLRTLINKVALRYPDVKVICLDCGRMIGMDYTSASALASLVKALRKTGKELVLLKCEKEWVEMMGNVGLAKMECFGERGDVGRWMSTRAKEV